MESGESRVRRILLKQTAFLEQIHGTMKKEAERHEREERLRLERRIEQLEVQQRRHLSRLQSFSPVSMIPIGRSPCERAELSARNSNLQETFGEMTCRVIDEETVEEVMSPVEKKKVKRKKTERRESKVREKQEDDERRRIEEKGKEQEEMAKVMDEMRRIAKEREQRAKEKVAARLRKLKARRRLRIFLWAIVFPTFLFSEVRKKMAKKRESISSVFSTMLNDVRAQTLDFLSSMLAEPLRKINEEKSQMCVVSGLEKGLFGPKALSNSELETRCRLIKERLGSLLSTLCDRIKAEDCPPQLLSLLTTLTSNQSYLPQGFLFDFEIQRLAFTHYGTLKLMNGSRVKMMICFYVVVRLLLHQIVLHPWDLRPKMTVTDTMRRNVKTIGSVLLHVVVELFRTTAPMVPNNQVHLPMSLKLKPRGEPLKAERQPVDPEEFYVRPKKTDVDDIISGAYTREQLSPFFDRSVYSDHIRALLEHFLDRMSSFMIKR
eukprot:TRINITY_DN11899_c0_g1_i1.p1 TRINITY_DN11899_c0_g1~~TRINITY_DN11899_c0_g1_i1.p1  ORF type:complete len:491 (+),score=121.50 TRINITY_DN11899_c0_g1_i1:341-1813(+)